MTDSSTLEATAVHDVLSNERRRMLLSVLAEDERSYTMNELSERIAERESGVEPAPRDVRQSVYVSLQQTHVPRLVDLGIVEYGEDERAIRLGDSAEDVTVYLEVVSGYEIAWSEYYLGVGVLGLLTVLAAVVGVPVVSAFPVSVIAGSFLGCIALSAAFHTRTLNPSLLDRLRE
ncbi:DUF7344 domain-containing protein [Halorarum halobium]|uniref:DUF7344 domain-containing protein n=1 Tax=Halorarum halobium TaxID=3075121 RepID=UPI0028A64474|nr:hypothetical protein [Halobaculum sp. XH14]